MVKPAVAEVLSTMCSTPVGPAMTTGASRPWLPMDSKSPGRPLTWSPWKCVISTASMGLKVSPQARICVWVPSPQSMSRLRPLWVSMAQASARSFSGIMPPVPGSVTRSMASSRMCGMSRGVQPPRDAFIIHPAARGAQPSRRGMRRI